MSDYSKAKKKLKKYYKAQKKQAKKQKDFSVDKLEADFAQLMSELGFEKDTIIQDYTRNVKRIEENKAADLEDINISLNRSQEDATTSLKKEARRYSLEEENLKNDQATKNILFGGLAKKQQGEIADTNQENVNQIETAKRRSFQDLQREEFLKIRDYSRQSEDAATNQQRSLQENIFKGQRGELTKSFGIRGAELDYDITKENLEYGYDSDKALIKQMFAQQAQKESLYY